MGVVIDEKFKFSQHIGHAADKCTKVIFSLPNLRKSIGELTRNLNKDFKRGNLPLLQYSAPVSIDVLSYEYNRRNCIGVKRLMNLMIAKNIALRPAKL